MEIIAAMEKQAITPGTFYIYFVCDFLIDFFYQGWHVVFEVIGWSFSEENSQVNVKIYF